jgi:hypothetical protein
MHATVLLVSITVYMVLCRMWSDQAEGMKEAEAEDEESRERYSSHVPCGLRCHADILLVTRDGPPLDRCDHVKSINNAVDQMQRDSQSIEHAYRPCKDVGYGCDYCVCASPASRCRIMYME